MRSSKTLLMIGIGAAVLSLGITAVVGRAMAQTAPTPTPAPAQSSTPAQSKAKTDYQNFFLGRLAADLGTTTDKLKSAFTQARNETVDQAVKDGRLTQQQADQIKANTNAGPAFGIGFGFGRGEMRGGGAHGFVGGPQGHQWQERNHFGARPWAGPSNPHVQAKPAA